MTYQETLEYLYGRLAAFHLVGGVAYKPGLENTLKLMNTLNRPHEKFKSIHVAGTNGKGSVSHFLAAILQKAGYKVGLYTSPHLVDFGERIRVNGEMIAPEYVVEFVEDLKMQIDNIKPSFFEISMAMAFTYFADKEVDIAVIEVGMGGRLDSTNIILPELSIITNIGLDHVTFLGDTLQEIAGEKAGIIKPGIPVVIGEVLPETRPVFENKATISGALIIYAENQPAVIFESYKNAKMIISQNAKTYCSGLNGRYQLKNIATVLTSVDELRKQGFTISQKALSEGLEFVCELTGLRGRWEQLHSQPLVIADTAHNVAGISEIVKQLSTQNYNNLRIVLGMVNDKDIRSVLAILPQTAVYYFTQASIKRAIPSLELSKMASEHQLNGATFHNVADAITSAMSDADEEDMVLVTGSNFLVGEVLSMNLFKAHN